MKSVIAIRDGWPGVGERRRKYCREDSAFHIDFLASAIESDSTAAFADYARWLARVLHSHNISPLDAVKNFERIRCAPLAFI
jgi:hypothetical protein